MDKSLDALVADGRALLAKATPGPWNHLGYCGQDGVIQGPRQVPVASAIAGKTSGATGHQAFDDAALIVWLRNNAATLLDLAEQSTPAGMVMVPIEEAAVLCARLEHDASYDKCGHGYYRLKTALSAAPDPAKPVSCTCQRYPTHCANDCPEHGLDEPTYTAGERVDVPPVSPTIPEGMVADEPCSLGVGCDEAGVCYADALGQPDKCGRKPVSTPRVTEIADIIRAYNPKPCGVEWPRNAAVAILQALSTEKQG